MKPVEEQSAANQRAVMRSSQVQGKMAKDQVPILNYITNLIPSASDQNQQNKIRSLTAIVSQ